MDAWLVALIGFQMAFVVAIVWIVFKHFNARAQRRAEIQARILEKFESPQELSEFLVSSDGKNLLRFLAPSPKDPRAALASGMKAALILFFLGAGFFTTSVYINDNDLMVPAFIFLFLAIGIGVASMVGDRLSRDQDSSTNEPERSTSVLTD